MLRPATISTPNPLGCDVEQDSTRQEHHADVSPALCAERQELKSIQETHDGHDQKEGTRETAVHATTAASVHEARAPHDEQRYGPPGCNNPSARKETCQQNDPDR